MQFVKYFLQVALVGFFLFAFACKKQGPLQKGQMRMEVNGESVLLAFNGKITIVNDTDATMSAQSGPKDKVFRLLTTRIRRFGSGELLNSPEYPIRVIMELKEDNFIFSSHYLNNLIGEAKVVVEEINMGEKFVKGKFEAYLRGLVGTLETRNIKDGEFFLAISY